MPLFLFGPADVGCEAQSRQPLGPEELERRLGTTVRRGGVLHALLELPRRPSEPPLARLPADGVLRGLAKSLESRLCGVGVTVS